VSWFELFWAAALLLLLLAVTGGSLAWAVGLRGFAALATAPAFGITMIGGTAIVAQWVGLSWSVVSVLVVTLVVGAALWGARFAYLRTRSQPEEEGERTRPRFDVWLLVASIAAILVLSFRLADAVGLPTNFSQTFDNIFHLNAVRFILDTGNASSLAIGRMTNPGGALGFYPAAWHGAVSLIVQLSGVSIPVAVNAMSIVVGAVIWPLGAVLLTRILFGRGRVLTISAAILATAFPLFPLLLLDYGVLYPYQLGLSLVPIALAATAQVFGLGQRVPGFSRWWWTLVLLGTLPGIALAHPGALVSWLALSVPMVIAFAIAQWRAHSSARSRVLIAGAFAAYIVAGILALKILRPPLEARGWPTTLSVPAAVWEVLSISTWYGAAALVAILAVLAGIIWALIARTPASLVALGMYLVAAILFVTVVALPFGTLRDALTGAWYNNTPRLAAMLPLVMVTLGAYGVARTASALATIPVVERIRASTPPSGRVLLGAALAVGGMLAVQGAALAQATTSVSALFAITPTSPLVNSDEYALLNRVDQHVPEGVAIAGSPWNGSSLAYALADRPVLMPHTLMEITQELELVNEGLVGAKPGGAVCEAVEILHVGFVLDFGSQEVHGAQHEFPGFEDLGTSDRVRLVDEQGEARLYEIVACGPSANR